MLRPRSILRSLSPEVVPRPMIMKSTTLSLSAIALLLATAFSTNVASSRHAGGEAPKSEEPGGAPRAVILGDYDADGLSDLYAALAMESAGR